MWRRVFAILVARNREFYRDRASLAWNLVMPILMLLAFAFLFQGERPLLRIGVLGADGRLEGIAAPLLELRSLVFVPIASDQAGLAIRKVERQQLDLLLAPGNPPRYWVNATSERGRLAEHLLLKGGALCSAPDTASCLPQRQTLAGRPLRYVDWVLPGVLAMNLMFSSLWGVGWVIVRYRKNHVLRRLKATPLNPIEFLLAQVLSRLLVVLVANALVYALADGLLDVEMQGSFWALGLVYASGALCLVSLGLIVAARLRNEELADGLLNLISWPMLLFSGVWFSLEGANPIAQGFAQLLPLTHLVDAARAVMLDGAGMAEVWPEVLILLAFAAVFLMVAVRLFRWE